MSPNLRLRPFSFLAKTKIKQSLALSTLMFISITFISLNCWAQQTTAAQPDSQSKNSVASANPAPGTTTITVPAGVSIALVLMHPIQSRYVRRGDDIYAQTTSPVVAGNEVVIPPGTFVQGKVDKLSRNGGRAELYLQSMSITYPDGYVAPIAGPVTLESGDGYALKDPGKGRMVGAFALPAAGLGLGALIGHSTASSQGTTITNSLPPGCTGPPPACLSSSLTGPPDTGKNTAIGAMVGGAIGGIASIALLFNTHNFFLDVGSPVEMVLQRPLTLEQDQVADAIIDAARHPAPPQPIAPRPQPLPPFPDSTEPPPAPPVILPPPTPPLPPPTLP